ncbi:CO/xanthine dehydrogenase Mo-binding subunit [Bradyrhizobium sp. GM6.1]
MGVEGIGASVVRKEDKRFITGKGRYVDDIKLQGMTHAHFIRSPHAHAKVKGIDPAEALKMPGVVAVLTGQQIVDDKVGNLICGWAITSKDGSPMKMGAWPAMAPETVRFVGQAVAVVIAETKNLARDAGRSRGRELRRAARGRRRPRRDQVRRAAATSRSSRQPGL